MIVYLTILLIFNNQFSKINTDKTALKKCKDSNNYYYNLSKYRIFQPGCRIRAFDDKYVKGTYGRRKYPCEDKAPDILVSTNETTFFIRKEIMFQGRRIECCYQNFWRAQPKGHQYLHYAISEKCAPIFLNTMVVTNHQFILVRCNVGEKHYKYFLNFILKKTVGPKLKKQKRPGDYLSVLIVGLDSTSHENLYKQLPETVRYLKSKLFALELLGYNPVGNSTYPNTLALTTGLSKVTSQTPYMNNTTIWNVFSKKGYITTYIDDKKFLNPFYMYGKPDTFRTQIDHDYRIFRYVASHINSLDTRCFGNIDSLEAMFDYAIRFVTKYSSNLYLGYFWQSSTSYRHSRMLDEFYYVWLRDNFKNGFFSNTVVIFMADRGDSGNKKIKNQGLVKAQVPFVFFCFPNWFKKKYAFAWNNMIRNTVKLTTPYDVYRTIMDLGDLRKLKIDNLMKRMANNRYSSRRGVSLFLPISSDRTCETASIPEKLCICEKQNVVNEPTEISPNGIPWMEN